MRLPPLMKSSLKMKILLRSVRNLDKTEIEAIREKIADAFVNLGMNTAG